MRRALQAVLALTVALMLCAAADDPADRLANPAQEARARAVFKQVRCLVCQGQSIDESDAPLARDLRQLIRHDIAIGWSDDQVRAYLVSRYGEFPLEAPRFSLGNAALWGVPLAVLIAGMSVLVIRSRRKASPRSVELTADEEAVLRTLAEDEPL